MNFSAFDHSCMTLALRLAEQGINTTHPNPRVGCVVVADGEIVGQGWHRVTGGAHAEMHALADAGDLTKGATAYVTLEPCSHHGLTPPCSEALIRAGVKRVVCAMQDPNPDVAGKGIAQLQSAGVEVDCGLMSAAAEELNLGFLKRMRQGMPWVRVKMAQSLDGHIALSNGTSQWISGPPAREDVQAWRARSDAILTGIGTILADDPRLDVRIGEQDGERLRQPLRVIADSHWRTPADARLLNDGGGPVLIAGVDQFGADQPSGNQPSGNQPGVDQPGVDQLGIDRRGIDRRGIDRRGVDRRGVNHPGFSNSEVNKSGTNTNGIPDALVNSGAELCLVPSREGRVDLKALLELLARRGINEVQVEAGAMLGGALLAQNLIDELLIYQAPILLGGGAVSPFAAPRLDNMAHRVHLKWLDSRRVGDDLRLRLRPEN